ncbi:MAG: OsmC family protein [Candidatus Bathyarchaeia archaeon]
MLITPTGDFQFKVRCRRHELVCDQPDRRDEGMTPPELFAASLGACIGVYVENYCRQARIPVEGMTIDVEWDKEQNPARIGSIRVSVKVPGVRARGRLQAIRRAAESCLIHNTLKQPPQVSLTVEAG